MREKCIAYICGGGGGGCSRQERVPSWDFFFFLYGLVGRRVVKEEEECVSELQGSVRYVCWREVCPAAAAGAGGDRLYV